MPFKIIKKGVGYVVKNIISGKTYSKKSLTKEKAIKQKDILEKYEKKENKKIKTLNF